MRCQMGVSYCRVKSKRTRDSVSLWHLNFYYVIIQPLHRGTSTEGYRSVVEHLTIMDKALDSILLARERLVREQTKHIFL